MTEPPARYDDLTALFINCTLKRSPELSHTGGLIDIGRSIMDRRGVTVDIIRAVDHDIATGVWARHDRAWLAKRRVAGDLPDAPGG